MKTLFQYGGSIIVLLVTVALAVCFYTDVFQASGENNVYILGSLLVVLIIGILLLIVGGKAADKFVK